MAITFVDYTATAAQTDFAFNFEYLEDEHVTVTIDGVAKTLGELNDYTVVVESNGDKKVRLNVAAAGGEIVRVRRISAPAQDLVDFVNGSVLTESELDRAYLHNRYLAEESAEQNDISLRVKTGATGSFDALNKKIVNVSDPTADQDAATKNYVDDTVAGVVGGTIPDGSITAAKLDTDAVTTVKIEDAAVTSAKIEDAAVTSVKIEDGAVTSVKTDFNEVVVNNTSGNGRVEVGGTTGAYIDLKTPDTDDYDGRLWIEGDTEALKVIGKHGLEFKVGTNPSTVCTIDSNGDLDITGVYKKGSAILLLDEDTMSSNSDTQGATQQSIKAYVDSQVVSKYDSGWFNDSGTGLTNGSTYTFTHTLGTADIQVQVYMATNSSGAGQTLCEVIYAKGTPNLEWGLQVKDVTSSNITTQLGADGTAVLNTSGVISSSNWGATYTHIKVIAIG